MRIQFDVRHARQKTEDQPGDYQHDWIGRVEALGQNRQRDHAYQQ